MPVVTKTIPLHTQPGDILDISHDVQERVTESSLADGIATVFCPGSTGAISTTEFEPGLVKSDIPAVLDRIVDPDTEWTHHKTWGDHNGAGHLRSFLLKPDLTVPFSRGHLMLGRWQQIIYLELDEKSRDRELIVQIIGE
jgi:secondary thiamine-phosphate synthase enzyme